MLHNVKHYLANHEGIDWYSVTSLVLFFLVFIAMVIFVYKIPKKTIHEIKNYPLNDQNEEHYDTK